MFKRYTALLAAFTLAAAATSTGASAQTTTHEIRDEFGFERPMRAMTVTLPDGWNVSGNVQWTGHPSCLMEPMKLHFMATAPDGKRWVEFIPGGVWGWTSNFDAMPHTAQQGFAGCDARPIRDIRSFADQYIPSIRPNARIQSMRPRPDQAQKLLAEMGNLGLQPGQYPRMEVLEVRLSYEANGHTISELLMPAVLFIDQRAADMWGGMSGYVTTAMAVGTITSAQVDGEAQESLADFVGAGMKHDPQYLNRVAQRYQQRSQMIAAATQRKRAAQQAWLKANAARIAANSATTSTATSGGDALDSSMDSWRRRNGMTDAGQSKLVNAIHERRVVVNNQNQAVYMPQQYQRVFQLPNDAYVGTNDRFFNSVRATGEFGTELSEYGY
ncbi:MAG: hypothetical protein AAFY44_11230 [Pseudomonadota bacterium]